MTLLLNEIHLVKGLTQTFLVAAADRRITVNGKYHSTRRKLFDIPYLQGAVSYYGLAYLCPGRQLVYLSSWLPDFIKVHYSVTTLEDFVRCLREELHRAIPPETLKINASGFHVCGYQADGLPDFWHLRNWGKLDGYRYSDLQPRYLPPTSDFLYRDAKSGFRWDGVNPGSASNGLQVYRNGDFRAHALASEYLDNMLCSFLRFSDFDRPVGVNGYAKYVKFKLEVLAYIYRKWAKQKIIDRPIDVITHANVVKGICAQPSN
jgi:hypothetical protein